METDLAKPGSGNPVAQQSSRPNGVVFFWTPTYLDAAQSAAAGRQAGAVELLRREVGVRLREAHREEDPRGFTPPIVRPTPRAVRR